MTSVPDTILNTPPSSFDQSSSIVPPSRCCRPRTRKQAPLARRRFAPAHYTQDGARGFAQHAHAPCLSAPAAAMPAAAALTLHPLRSSWAARRHSLHFSSSGVLVRSACAQPLRGGLLRHSLQSALPRSTSAPACRELLLLGQQLAPRRPSGPPLSPHCMRLLEAGPLPLLRLLPGVRYLWIRPRWTKASRSSPLMKQLLLAR
jgi:hypothetical protein